MTKFNPNDDKTFQAFTIRSAKTDVVVAVKSYKDSEPKIAMERYFRGEDDRQWTRLGRLTMAEAEAVNKIIALILKGQEIEEHLKFSEGEIEEPGEQEDTDKTFFSAKKPPKKGEQVHLTKDDETLRGTVIKVADGKATITVDGDRNQVRPIEEVWK
jgi:hypothetical protein